MSLSTTSRAASPAVYETSRDLLLQPIKLGRYTLPSRIVMAPLTRSRSRQPGTYLNACGAW